MADILEMQTHRKIENENREQDRLAQIQLQKRLRCQFGFSAADIIGRCAEGVFVLEGHADSFYHKQMAQELARSIAGVRFVVNRIVVDPSRSRDRVVETFCPGSSHRCN